MADFSHLNEAGEAAMVDVSGKAASVRTAVVAGTVKISDLCSSKLNADALREICSTARIAGVTAAKQTSILIPMCHQIPLSQASIEIVFQKGVFDIIVTTKTESNTGVEMEAICAASIAGATIYDMVKAVDPAAVIGPFMLIEKHGGKNDFITYLVGIGLFSGLSGKTYYAGT